MHEPEASKYPFAMTSANDERHVPEDAQPSNLLPLGLRNVDGF